MLRVSLLLTFATIFSISSFSQQNIGIGTTTPDPSAAVDVSATNKGVLIPRISNAERNAIGSPAAGLFIYNTDANLLQYWNGTAWMQLSGIAEAATNPAGTGAGIGVAIANSGSAPDPSAVLDIQSATGGLLVPRMSSTQRNAIVAPVSSLVIFNTTTEQLNFYTSSGWTSVCETNVSSSTGAVSTVANVGVNTKTPDPSAMLDITSTIGGMAIPRLTTSQRNAIQSPAQGLMIYNTTTQTINFYDGEGHWLELSSPVAPSAPIAGTPSSTPTSITWNWTSIGGSGYKYNTINNYATAIDNGASSTYTQTGTICNSNDTLYVWAYNCSGNSSVTLLTDSPGCWVCGDTLIDTRDGRSYPTVQIGTQCWMAQNLNYGNWISISAQQQYSPTQKYCSNLAGTGDDTSCPYGGLYDWYTVMNWNEITSPKLPSCDGVYANGSISGYTMTLTSVPAGGGVLTIGDTISGSGVTAGTTITGFSSITASACYNDRSGNLWMGGTLTGTGTFGVGQYLSGKGVIPTLSILSQISGTTGGAGAYQTVTNPYVLGAGAVIVATSSTSLMDVTVVDSGVLAVGQNIYEPIGGFPAGETITAFGTGTSTASTITGTTLIIGGTETGYYGVGSVLTGTGIAPGTYITAVKANTSTSSKITGTTLTIGGAITGYYGVGQTITGTGVSGGTAITAQLSGTAGGAGTYSVNISQTVPASGTEAISSANSIVTNTATNSSISDTTLTIGGTVTGCFGVGQLVSGSGVTAGTYITALGTGTGGAGTYTVNNSQTIGAATVTANLSATSMTVTSVTSGTLGLGATITGAGIAGGTTVTSFGTNSAQPCKIVGTTLTIGVGSLSGYYGVGQPLVGTGVTPGTIITGQLTGTPGGVGTYSVNISQTSGTNEYINSTSVGGVGNYNVNASMTTGTGVTVTSTQPLYSNSGGGVGSYTVSTSQTVSSEAINTAATGGTGIYIVSLPMVVAGPSQTMTVYGGDPVAISTVAGGTGTYTVSTTETTGNTVINNYMFPQCKAPVRGICPTGWHVPSQTEWTWMENGIYNSGAFPYGDYTPSVANIGFFGTTEGDALKQTDTTYWVSPNAGATNSVGFNGLGAGISANYKFSGVKLRGDWYTSTGNANDYFRELDYNSSQIFQDPAAESNGMSLRCVKN